MVQWVIYRHDQQRYPSQSELFSNLTVFPIIMRIATNILIHYLLLYLKSPLLTVRLTVALNNAEQAMTRLPAV